MPEPLITGRFAPTTSGRAHPGTLLSALLVWWDLHSQGGRTFLRWEDIDPSARSRTMQKALVEDLAWLGLDWDETVWQSQLADHHEQALECLASQGRLYECSCSRTDIRQAGLPSASGGWVYPGTCRPRVVRNWRMSHENLRCNLEGFSLTLTDESGADLSQNVPFDMGDPLVRRADGSVTYQLAVVADDAASGITRVVRGRDLATSTATQAALYQLLKVPTPQWHHHFLLREQQGEKFAKLHQSVGADQLRQVYQAPQLVALLMQVAGLLPGPRPEAGRPVSFEPAKVEPQDFRFALRDFSWHRVTQEDQTLLWDGQKLSWWSRE